jgi:hypothetical protein
MYVDQILNKVDGIKNSQGGPSYRNRSAFACMLVGGVTGLMIGFSKKWNLFYSALGGGLIGGVAGSLLVPRKKE